MNFFFGFNNHTLKSEIQIPTFINRSFKASNLDLFKCYPENNRWVLKDISFNKINDYFYILKNSSISNNEIYFLADRKIYENFDSQILKNYNSFTDTSPSYRSNFKIYIEDEGFSSFQSEYPYSMVYKQGSILSALSSLCNAEADDNYIIFKNIYYQPIHKNFNGYFVNYLTKKIENKFNLFTNSSNIIKVDKSFIKPEIFFITDDYLGIPMYLSIKNGYLSLEHTHPPHEYILGNNKFIKVSELKKELNEIIN